jgi:hypothetical protein
MPNLVYSEKFERMLRLDRPEEIGIPTQDLLEAALEQDKPEEALVLLAYMRQESEIVNKTVLGGWLASLLEYFRERAGQSGLEVVLRIPGQAVWQGFEELAQLRYAEAESALKSREYRAVKMAVEGMRQTYLRLNDLVVRWVQDLLTYLADTYGEEEPARAMRPAYDRIWRERYRLWTKLTPEEQLALSAEGMRAHFGGPTRRGEFKVRDEGDRYAMFFDPCGTGGIMRRGDPVSGAGPYPTHGLNRLPKDWTWGKSGVHWYCTHCSLYVEKFPAEDYGYPIRPLAHNLDPQAPCVWYIYKDPALTRPEHFLAIGLKPPVEGVRP